MNYTQSQDIIDRMNHERLHEESPTFWVFVSFCTIFSLAVLAVMAFLFSF
jgi:hypothetical protein